MKEKMDNNDLIYSSDDDHKKHSMSHIKKANASNGHAITDNASIYRNRLHTTNTYCKQREDYQQRQSMHTNKSEPYYHRANSNYMKSGHQYNHQNSSMPMYEHQKYNNYANYNRFREVADNERQTNSLDQAYLEFSEQQRPYTNTIRYKHKSRVCSNCNTQNTPSWRRSTDRRSILCNACGLYQRLHNRSRPFFVNFDGKTKAAKPAPMVLVCCNCNKVSTKIVKHTTDGKNYCDYCSFYFSEAISNKQYGNDGYNENFDIGHAYAREKMTAHYNGYDNQSTNHLSADTQKFNYSRYDQRMNDSHYVQNMYYRDNNNYEQNVNHDNFEFSPMFDARYNEEQINSFNSNGKDDSCDSADINSYFKK